MCEWLFYIVTDQNEEDLLMTDSPSSVRYSVYLPEDQAEKFEELFKELEFVRSKNRLMGLAIMKFVKDMRNSGDAALFLGGVINEQENEPKVY